MEEVLVERVGRPEQGLVVGGLACVALRWGACDQLPEQGSVFQWVAEVPYERVEALEGHDLEAWRRLVGLEGNPEEEGRHVAAQDRDREPRVAEEEVAGHRLRTIAVEVHLVVSRRYAPGRRPATVLKRA